MADKKSGSFQMKLTHFKSNHNWFILYTQSQNYTIIKNVQIKKFSIGQSWEINEMKQMKSLGKTVSGQMDTFIPN